MTTSRTRSGGEILVLLDGSMLAEATLPHAVKLARALDARVLLLMVLEPSEGETIAGWPPRDRARYAAQLYLCRISRLFAEFGVPVDTQVTEGHPAERALEVARDAEARLVLLSTHGGRTGLTPFPMSGTASKILSAGGPSVMVVRSEEGPGLPLDLRYRTVLAPVDLTPNSDASARVAAEIAREEGAELLLTTVLPAPELVEPAEAGEDSPACVAEWLTALNRERAERHLAALADALGRMGVPVRTRVARGNEVAATLESLADEVDASLVVLGAHGSSEGDDHPHGVVAGRLLERVRRPLLVIRDGLADGARTRAQLEAAATPAAAGVA